MNEGTDAPRRPAGPGRPKAPGLLRRVRIQPAGSLAELIHARQTDGLFDLLFRGVAPAQNDVVAHGSGEQGRLLRQPCNAAPPRVVIDPVQGWPSIRIDPRRGAAKPSSSVKSVDLPAPLGPVTARCSAGSDGKAHAVEHGRRRVREMNVLEGDCRGRAAASCRRRLPAAAGPGRGVSRKAMICSAALTASMRE